MAEKVQSGKKAVESQSSEAVANSPLDVLAEYGGFSFLENIIDGFSNLNPKRKARRNIFLEDELWGTERDNLANRLNIWIDLLKSGKDVEGLRDIAVERAQKADEILNSNLRLALNSTKDLERAYRSVAHFYKNTEEDKVKNITIINADIAQLKDLDNPLFINYVSNELKQNFDRLDLRDNYGILNIPGYLGSNAVLDKWSKIAYENKTALVTDFEDLESPDDVLEIFSNANHTGGDIFKSNTLMTCNWLLGRKKDEVAGEEDNLYVPPSSALSGKIYSTLMSQVVAGKKFGGMNEVENVRFDLKKSEISELERAGLVPLVNEYSKVMAFSAKTLFNGDNLGLQTYSVVRVFDHISKVLFDFLNRKAFENWTIRTETDLRSQIVKFLDGIKGPNSLIEKFKIMKIEQDPNQKDRVLLDIHITPYFPAKSFVIQLDGYKGDGPEATEWQSEYNQE
ncbi:MAG: type VI secretion system contractile sheath protein TssC [Fluviicola sp.]|nr:MAG: type VI secretion system contractile sheath protein TssC [Fluviicola sp.]